MRFTSTCHASFPWVFLCTCFPRKSKLWSPKRNVRSSVSNVMRDRLVISRFQRGSYCTRSWVPLVCLRPQSNKISFRRIFLYCQSKHTCSKNTNAWTQYDLVDVQHVHRVHHVHHPGVCSPGLPWSSLPKSGRGQPHWKLENALDAWNNPSQT